MLNFKGLWGHRSPSDNPKFSFTYYFLLWVLLVLLISLHFPSYMQKFIMMYIVRCFAEIKTHDVCGISANEIHFSTSVFEK